MHCARVGGFARRQASHVNISSGANLLVGAFAPTSGTNQDSSISGKFVFSAAIIRRAAAAASFFAGRLDRKQVWGHPIETY